jgi:integrase
MPKALLESHTHPKYPRLKLQLRIRSQFYQGLVFLDGRKYLKSLKTTSLTTALKLGEEWYRQLLKDSDDQAKRHPIDRLSHTPTMGELAAAYKKTLAPSKRDYLDMKWSTIQPFWRALSVDDITAQTFRDFYVWRRRMRTKQGTRIKNHSLHKDVMIIRQTLTFALEEAHITQLPPIPKIGKIDADPRPWFTPTEWKRLIAVMEDRVMAAMKAHQERVFKQRLDCYDFMRLMVLLMTRVDELRALRYSDCTITRNTKGHPTSVTAHVSGKTGTRTVVAPREAGSILDSRQGRLDAADTDLIFPHHVRDAFRELLLAAKLRTNAQGFPRNLKSLRCTAISFRVLQSPENLLAIARNAGTSLAMIDTFYAARLGSERWHDGLSVSLGVAGDTLSV